MSRSRSETNNGLTTDPQDIYGATVAEGPTGPQRIRSEKHSPSKHSLMFFQKKLLGIFARVLYLHDLIIHQVFRHGHLCGEYNKRFGQRTVGTELAMPPSSKSLPFNLPRPNSLPLYVLPIRCNSPPPTRCNPPPTTRKKISTSSAIP